MKRKIIKIIFAIVIAVILFFIFPTNCKKNRGVNYTKEVIAKGDIVISVDAFGTLNPVTLVDIGSQVSGKVAELYVDFNSKVKKGETLVVLDQSLFLSRVRQNEANYLSVLAALEKAKVNLNNVEKKYNRAVDLFEKNLISLEEKENAEVQYWGAKADIQSAQARLEQAKSQLNSSKIDLNYTVIKSPIDGVITNRNINLGQTVAASFRSPILFQVVNDLTKMQVECSIDEADVGMIKQGQRTEFIVDAFPQEKFFGKLTQVRYFPEVIQNIVTYTAIIKVENPEMKLLPGITAMVSIIVDEVRDVIIVPNSALRFAQQLLQPASTKTSSLGGDDKEKNLKSANNQALKQTKEKEKSSIIWVENDKGEINSVSIELGITDNIYTEVKKIIDGTLKEGQFVIIGIKSGTRDERQSSTSDIARSVGRILK